MFGEGISVLDLISLLKAIREKNLILQVKIIDGQWEDMSTSAIKDMIAAVTDGHITHTSDIRLRLFAKGVSTSIHP